MIEKNEIICAGEILWDSLPAGLFLGGAPFNVAHDLHMLGKRAGIISRVGRDVLGDRALRRLRVMGIPTDMIQVDEELSTGLVEVELDSGGTPAYRIREPAAWDAIQLEADLLHAVGEAGVLVFGTLASRNELSRRTIHDLIDAASVRVYDVNLRPGVNNKDLVGELLAAADVVKVNSEELNTLREWFGLLGGDKQASEELAKKFSCKMIAVSLGALGGSLWHDGHWINHPGFKVCVETTVGAGDAFLAGLLGSIIDGKPDEETMENANLLGAYVVTRSEATPPIDMEKLESIKSSINSG